MDTKPDSAYQIAQTYLSAMAASVMSGDFAAYHRGVSLPFAHMTGDGLSLVRDEETLKAGFDAYRDNLKAMSVTELVQDVTEAEQLDSGHIVAYYNMAMSTEGETTIPSHNSWVMLSKTPEGD